MFFGGSMILFRLKELIAKKEKRENRKVTLQEISQHTGVNRTSLSKMQNPDMKYSATTSAIDALCRYFDCKIQDILVYKKDPK
jgi:putative transcriptional regulator